MSSIANQPSLNATPEELLQYLTDYRVLVCTSCRYAIQPAAIARHLKEIHSIKRGHRKPYMEYVEKFDLSDLEEVIACKPSKFPVPLLPVQEGLRCTHDGCSHLCMTDKRMKSHWLSVHHRRGEANVDFQSAPLQTFFKGNLLRYFTGISIKEVNQTLANFKCTQERQVTENFQSSGTKTIQPPMQTTNGPVLLGDSDKALLYFWISNTSASIALNNGTVRMWQVVVPQLAHQFSFLMHSVLACAALHSAYLNPRRCQEFTIQARNHQDQGLPLFRAAIVNVTEDNCDAVHLFAHLLVINSFASNQQDQCLLIVAEPENTDVMPAWLHFLRNGCSMLCHLWDKLEAGPVGALASAWEIPIDISAHPIQPLVNYLVAMTQDEWSDDTRNIYRGTAIELARAFSCMNALGDAITTWDAVRIWPMRLSIAYMELLKQKHPSALILLAHYCIVLKRLELNWYFEDRAASLLSTISHHLDVKWHSFIQWPLEEVGARKEAWTVDFSTPALTGFYLPGGRRLL
ncbi:hypothetical protein BJ875DRAFT_490216 [Amylocarpus encephaloides]|uniref:C2H2-type domain-containing protein n=1 Tax=Amylocarpus encephaloides TaxID=45428 RepID=A0A9P8BZF9_9HELO|nr:hypothetical protein BJ875DRAFT_490216 [Amylocarpus encephaloides]